MVIHRFIKEKKKFFIFFKGEFLPLLFYWRDVLMQNIEDYIVEADCLYAHIGELENEKLKSHAELTFSFLQLLKKGNGLQNILERIVLALRFDDKPLEKEAQELIKVLFEQAVYLHDIGKINPAFQKIKLKNKLIQFRNNPEENDSNHSLLSALIYLDITLPEINKIKGGEIRGFLRHVSYCFSYVISRHHTFLENLPGTEFLEKIKRLQQKVQKVGSYLLYYKNRDSICNQLDLDCLDPEVGRYEDGHEPFSFYILNKLLFSSLVACDFYATYTYENAGVKPSFRYFNTKEKEKIISHYHRSTIYQGIKSFEKNRNFFHDQPINGLRSELFLEAEKELLKNIHRNIFYLEAPTGGGKTNISINLGLNLLRQEPSLNKIIYVFPFNTLIEQTNKTLHDVFQESNQNQYRIAIVNSITPIVDPKELLDKETSIPYREELLYRQMLQYPITLTSHVNFFHYLFGTGRESNLGLVHLCNSVVILDEIQSYRNDRWIQIMEFLNRFSELLNIKLIIMSATLPKLDQLLNREVNQVQLIKQPQYYYQNPLFKKRVHLYFNLLDEGVLSFDRFLKSIEDVRKERGESRIFIEFIRKKSAREFYKILIKKFPNHRIIELTGDDNPYYRQQILKELGEMDSNKQFILRDVIVVSTQVIEAGVDIDMDVGFKDISLLDSEEQFLGRINRSCKRKDCRAYFFNMDNATKIYGKDWRLENNLLKSEYKNYLSEKFFHPFYEKCFQRLISEGKEKNNRNINHFYGHIRDLEFVEVAKEMELIDTRNYTLFIAYHLEMEDGVFLDGKEVWSEYKQLILDKNMDYAERQVRLSILKERVNFFTYSFMIPSYLPFARPKRFDDEIGNLFYIENGEDYMYGDPVTKVKKFDPELYLKESEGIFL